jgi:hypothetical protein
MLLPVTPQVFHWIEFRRIRWKVFNGDLAVQGTQELTHQPTAVRRQRLSQTTNNWVLMYPLDSTVASTILNIRSKQGEQEADAALARLAALPEVWKIQ